MRPFFTNPHRNKSNHGHPFGRLGLGSKEDVRNIFRNCSRDLFIDVQSAPGKCRPWSVDLKSYSTPYKGRKKSILASVIKA